MKTTLTFLFLSLAAFLSAQPDCLRTQLHGIESPSQFHPTVWVCTGDTLSIYTDSNGLTTTTIDGFWITCEEITRDVWRWFTFIDRHPAEGDNLPATGMNKAELDKFFDMICKSTNHSWRLPTREEWLLAFRGGIFGNDRQFSGSNRHSWVAWSKSNSGGMIHPVGERIPNDLGIYDMSGNAAEMATVGDSIVFMGGSYLDDFGPDNPNLRTPPITNFPLPQNEARGFRIVCHEPLKFNKYCERIF